MARIFDTEKIQNRIKIELDKLRDEIEDQKIITKIDEAETNINKEIQENQRIVYLPNQTRQAFTYTISGYIICHDERIAWHLYNGIMQLITLQEIKELIKNKYGEEGAIKIRNNLLQYGKTINTIKYLLDMTQDKEWTEEEYKKEHYKIIIQNLKKLPIITRNLYTLFIILCLQTSIGRNSVPQPAIDMHRRQYKKIPAYEQKKMDYQNKLEQQKQQIQDTVR